MTRANLAFNPSFRAGLAGYTALNGATLAVKTGYAFYGDEALQVIKPARSGAGVQSASIAVTPELKYAYSAYVSVPPVSPNQEDAGLVLTVTWLTAAGVILSTNSTPIVSIEPGSGWDRLTGVNVAPDNAAWATLSITQLVAGTARQTFYVDAILFEQADYVGGYLDNITQATHSRLQDRSLSALPLPTVGGLQLLADVSIGDLVLNTIDEDSVTWICTDIDGWWGHSEPDMVDITRGVDDGSYDVSGRYKARTFTLEGSFLLDDPAKLTATRDRLISATNLVRQGAWLRTNEEPTRAAFVRLNGTPKITTVNARGRTDFSIGLKAADPIRYEWNDQDPDGYTTVDVDVPPVRTNYLRNPSMEASSGVEPVLINYMSNPSAEGPAQTFAGIYNSTGSIVSDTTTGTGTHSYKIANSSGGSNSYFGGVADAVAAAPGDTWWGLANVRIDSSMYGPRRLGSQIRFFDVNGVELEDENTFSQFHDFTGRGTFHRWTGTANSSTSEEYSGTTKKTNHFTDPRPMTASTWGSSGVASGQAVYFSSSPSGRAYQVGFAANKTDGWYVRAAQNPHIPVTPGATVTMSLWGQHTWSGSVVRATVEFYDSSGTSLGYQNGTWTTIAAGVGVTLSWTGTVPATAATGDVFWDASGSGVIPSQNDYAFISAASDAGGTYFDGNTVTPVAGKYHAWIGTSNTGPAVERASDGTYRRNDATYPQPSSASDSLGGGRSGWASRWFGSGSSGTDTHLTGVADGPNSNITAYNRKTWTSVSDVLDVAWSHSGGSGNTDGIPVVPGETISMSTYIRPSVSQGTGGAVYAQNRLVATVSDASGNTLSTFNGNPPTALPAGQWTRYTLTFTVPAGGYYLTNVYTQVYLDSTTWHAGSTLDGTGLLIERSNTVGTYFDGSTTDPALVLATGQDLSTFQFAVSGYAPSRTTDVGFTVYGVGDSNTQATDAFYVDNIMLSNYASSTPPTYFDGSFAAVTDDDGDTLVYSWAGTPNASASISGYQSVALVDAQNASVYQSTAWTQSGTYSAKISPLPGTDHNAYMSLIPMIQGSLTNGNTYTLSLTAYRDKNGVEPSPLVYWAYIGDTQIYESKTFIPAAAGTYPLSISFTVPATATGQALSIYNFDPAGGSGIWVDDAILTDGSDIVSYFDGNSFSTSSEIYAWSGAEDASTSTKSPGPVTVSTVSNIGTSSVTGIFTMTGPLGAGSYIYNAGTQETITITNELRGVGGAAPITNTQLTNNVATITTSVPHNLEVGDEIIIAGAGRPYDTEQGSRTVTAVNDIYPYTFNFNLTFADLAAASASGQVNLANNDVLALDTYQRSVMFNGSIEGNRYRVATLVDWMQFAPGDNNIQFVDVPEQRTVTSKGAAGLIGSLTTDSAHFLQPGEQVYVNLPVSATLARKSLTSNVVTITTTQDHGFAVGDQINVTSTETSQIVNKAISSNVATLKTATLGAINVGDTITVSLPSTATVTAKSLTSNVATLNTSLAHGFSVGDQVTTTFPSTAAISSKNVSFNLATIGTTAAHGFAVGDTVSVTLPLHANIVNKFISGTNVVLTASAAHGYSIGDSIAVNLPTSATLTNSRSMAGTSTYLATLNTTTAHGFAVGDVVNVSLNIPDTWSVISRTATAGTMTITTSINHSVAGGEMITVTGVGAQYNGTWTVTSTTANTITYGNFGSGGTYTAEAATAVTNGTVVDSTTHNGYAGTHVIEAIPSTTSFSFYAYNQQQASSNGTVASPAGTVANTTNAPIVGTFRLSGTPSATQFSYQTTDTVNTGGTTGVSVS